jgi:hypothetical protein
MSVAAIKSMNDNVHIQYEPQKTIRPAKKRYFSPIAVTKMQWIF